MHLRCDCVSKPCSVSKSWLSSPVKRVRRDRSRWNSEALHAPALPERRRPVSETGLGNTGVARVRGARPPGLGSGGLCTPQHRGCTLPPRTPTAPVGGRITRRGRRWRCGGVSRGGATPLNYAARAGSPPSRRLSSRAEVEGLVPWVARRHDLGFLVGTQPGRRKPRRRATDVPRGRQPGPAPARSPQRPVRSVLCRTSSAGAGLRALGWAIARRTCHGGSPRTPRAHAPRPGWRVSQL